MWSTYVITALSDFKKKKVYLSKGFLTNRRSLKYLLPWSAPETIWVKLVGMKDVDGTFYAEMMQLTGDL